MKRIIVFFTALILVFSSLTSSAKEVFNVDLYIKDHKFIPEILKIPADKKIRITVYNQDSTIEEFESFELKREKIILGNSKALIILAPLKPGEYEFFGEFHQETAKGKIVVEENSEETEENV
jgi:plastocyanin